MTHCVLQAAARLDEGLPSQSIMSRVDDGQDMEEVMQNSQPLPLLAQPAQPAQPAQAQSAGQPPCSSEHQQEQQPSNMDALDWASLSPAQLYMLFFKQDAEEKVLPNLPFPVQL